MAPRSPLGRSSRSRSIREYIAVGSRQAASIWRGTRARKGSFSRHHAEWIQEFFPAPAARRVTSDEQGWKLATRLEGCRASRRHRGAAALEARVLRLCRPRGRAQDATNGAPDLSRFLLDGLVLTYAAVSPDRHRRDPRLSGRLRPDRLMLDRCAWHGRFSALHDLRTSSGFRPKRRAVPLARERAR